MISKTLTAGLIVAGCVGAAAAGGYLAMRQNKAAARPPFTQAASAPAVPEIRSVAETEAVVSAASPEPAAPAVAPAVASPSRAMDTSGLNARLVPRTEPARDRRRSGANPRDTGTNPATSVAIPAPFERPAQEPVVTAAPIEAVPEPVRAPEPLPFPEPRYDEVILPGASVVGLQIETTVSSERARVEDRVDARVTRDVSAAGRLAIPAGSHVIGSVTLVERGGKLKETARLGVRFHTLVLGDGREIPLRTEAILREGDSPGAESARKIGGAAIGGAILGAIMGGKKGAVLGGATGAAGGTAAMVNGDRNAATLPSGTVVTVKLTSPATIEVERR